MPATVKRVAPVVLHGSHGTKVRGGSREETEGKLEVTQPRAEEAHHQHPGQVSRHLKWN